MILLTRLNDKLFVLNACWIEQIESLPDTTITLTNGKKLVVKETVDEVQMLTTSFYKKVGILDVLEMGKEKLEDVQKSDS